MRNPFIVGEKVYLRPVELADAPILAACNNDPAVRVSFFTHTPTNIYQQTKHIESLYQPGCDYIPFVICPLEVPSDEGIGITALHRVDLVSHAAVYSIRICDPGHWGKGYGSEVTELMLHYAFDILNLHRVQLHVWTENTRGIRAYEKAGFVREGLLREAMMHNGKYCDFYVMGILVREWRALQEAKNAANAS
jgi:RimJ/RimL family protein N-acetyltransferase